MQAGCVRKRRVLVVEDENDLAVSLARALCLSGYEVGVSDRGESALRALRAFSADLILLDVTLPDMSGLDICRHVSNAADAAKPAIIILSGRASETDRVLGFKLGADDYAVKPFSLSELLPRIEARLRTRMRLLVNLVRVPGGIRTRRELLTEVWAFDPGAKSRAVDTHVKRLRDKLGGSSRLLQTIRGIGFGLAAPERPGVRKWSDPPRAVGLRGQPASGGRTYSPRLVSTSVRH